MPTLADANRTRYLTKDRGTVILSNRGTFDTDKLWEAIGRVLEKHLPSN